ncbi:TlyA family RNA methyltransferase [Aquabacterium sp.]|jgi:23S rRNA (cytidine1920-2'-O)/16S rRNA (cytidine1409-2'-O)-methyltransferase|uniref:TlyA family RNA methyltransferase n=1 Tax=Aquabacterium sp. TaxID=1872578 RepID=UPI001B528430|nr:TlyA family RNA methyltransferase [Aquabacterium sp.]MBP6612264.1 TlyA family RNA methyltransferase [Aquabacterium sp.]MBP7501862.1 TlyA family RNA methyltransferase [Aquabacterium sp.]MDD2977798.1 TlyA family RNA methyltransferase [Aquabacterium sp.]
MPRADQLIVQQGHAPTRSAAHRLIDARAAQWLSPQGWVTLRKAGEDLPEDAQFRVTNDEELRWVSRAGLKLEGALKQIDLDVSGLTCLDVGQSTGGFTDVLLSQGASRVVGVEVGHGQIHEKLKTDERVVVLENVNARELDDSPLREHAPAEGFDLIVADLSFIALSKIVPHLAPWLKPGGQVLMLIKPQFEVGKDHVGKGGVVKDPAQHARARDMVRRACTDLGWTVHKGFASSIAGGDGNLEFFIWAQSPQA